MELHMCCLLAATILTYAWRADAQQCAPRALTEAGWVCGACDSDRKYAQFLAVPYARQPVGELRFKELQSLEPWEGCRDATKVGPVCYQRDVFYGPIMHPDSVPSMSEECIHANVYVPLEHLPSGDGVGAKRALPVLVYVHGGGFDFGSGDPDAHGPQYLLEEDVIVITFNYRLGAFGFLSLNSQRIPGNAGLRDMVTLLRWVQRNVAVFGGDPDNVTLAGQSAGAAAAHLLSLSKPAQGLFRRAILMSGTATRGFFTTSPVFAQSMADMFLGFLNINNTNPEETYRQLIALPVERIMEAHNHVQELTGLLVFSPVVESDHPGVERIVDDDPEILQAQGRGKHIPFIIGFTNAECQTFQPRFDAIDIVKRVNALPALMLPVGVLYTTLPEKLPSKIVKIEQEYFNGTLNMHRYLRLCSESYFVYPALKLAESRAANRGAPVFLYRFAYNADFSVYKEALKLKYLGAGHSEDLTFIFRANHVLGDTIVSGEDAAMVNNMTLYVTNFMRYSKPTKIDVNWPSVKKHKLQYKNIINYRDANPSRGYRRTMKFFDSLYSPGT